MDNCVHRWVIESPQAHRERTKNVRGENKETGYASVCQNCGQQREFPNDRQTDRKYAERYGKTLLDIE